MAETVLKVNYVIGKNEKMTHNELIKIAKLEGISKENFEKAVFLQKNILRLSSINTYVGEDQDTELGDLIMDNEYSTEDKVINKILSETIESILSTLTDREKTILELRFGLKDGRERTLEEIGTVFGVTRERIRQIEVKAIRKLRHPTRSKKFKNYYIEGIK